VLVDAARGSVVLNLDLRAEALSRYICDGADKVRSSNTCNSDNDVRAEGGAVSSVGDVNAAYDYSGDVYRFLSTVLGRDSLDGNGMALKSMVRFCPSSDSCPYDNAYWDGLQMTYGRDYAKADDVVGHELAHGLTEHMSHLYYFYQSGAINESMSDVFGELIDQWNARDYYGRDSASLNWLMGEDLPGGAIRSMASPPLYDQPDRMRSALYWDGLDGDGVIVDNGGVHYNSRRGQQGGLPHGQRWGLASRLGREGAGDQRRVHDRADSQGCEDLLPRPAAAHLVQRLRRPVLPAPAGLRRPRRHRRHRAARTATPPCARR
jgi:hypothetical protein